MSNAIVFSTEASSYLADEMANELGAPRGKVERTTFADRETRFIIDGDDWDSLLDHDAILVGSTHDANNYLEFTDLLATLRKGVARKVIAVVPYLGWSTQERESVEGECTSALNRVRGIYRHHPDLTVWCDLHNELVREAHDGRRSVKQVSAVPVLGEHLRGGYNLSDLVLVSPDIGRGKVVQRTGKRLGISTAILSKDRTGTDRTETDAATVSLRGKIAVLLDDMIRTAGTNLGAAERCLEAEADQVVSFASHAVFPRPTIVPVGTEVETIQAIFNAVCADSSDERSMEAKLAEVRALLENVIQPIDAEQRVHDSCISGVVTTNTHPRSQKFTSPKFTVLPIGAHFASQLKPFLHRYGNGK